MKWLLFGAGMTTQHPTKEDAERFKRELMGKGIPSSEITIMSEEEYERKFG